MNLQSFIRAVRFIYDNLDKKISIQDVADAVDLSVSSLRRVFLEATNLSVGKFIRRLRMERAFRSIGNKSDSILEIALSSCFEDHSSFSRAFKNSFGYSPTFSREKLNIVNELDCITLQEPEIIEIEEIEIQSVTEKGKYFDSAVLAWQNLKNNLTEAELDDDFLGTFIGIGYDNPHDDEVAEDQVRFSAGVTLCERNSNFEKIVIPGGVYAKFTYNGKLNNLGLAYHYIYGAWSEKSTNKINLQIPAFIGLDKFPCGFDVDNLSISVPLKKL